MGIENNHEIDLQVTKDLSRNIDLREAGVVAVGESRHLIPFGPVIDGAAKSQSFCLKRLFQSLRVPGCFLCFQSLEAWKNRQVQNTDAR